MDLYVTWRSNAWANATEIEATAARSAKVGEEMSDRLRWIRTYVVKEPNGRFGAFCVYEANDTEALFEHARRVGIPDGEAFPVVETVVVRPDPVRTLAKV